MLVNLGRDAWGGPSNGRAEADTVSVTESDQIPQPLVRRFCNVGLWQFEVEGGGAEQLAPSVALLRKALGEPAFTLEVGPIIDGNLICGRWHLQGQYAGGMPGATAAPGSRVDFTGTDILRIDNGLLAEYWLNSDVHVMAAQLGMTT